MTIYDLSKKHGFKKIFNNIYKNFIKKDLYLNDPENKVEEIAIIFRNLYELINSCKSSGETSVSIEVLKNQQGYLEVNFPKVSKGDIFFSKISCNFDIEELNLIGFLYWSLHKK